MSFSWPRVLTIARREFLSTVRRKAFVFTLIGMPAYFAFVSWMAIKPQIAERLQALKSLTGPRGRGPTSPPRRARSGS